MTFGTLVWLYYLESGQLIGFGSVGPTKRQPDGSLPPVGLIPQLGVHRDFHRYPPGADRNDRISSAIVRDLISKARELQFGTLVLYVHKDNISAKNLYDRNQFVAVPPPDESGYETMMVRI